MSDRYVQRDTGITAGITRRFFVRVEETRVYEGYVDAADEEDAAEIAASDYLSLPCITEEYGNFHPQVTEVTAEDDR